MALRHFILSCLFLLSCTQSESGTAENSPIHDSETIDVPELDESISAGPLSGLYRNAGPASPVILIVPGSGPTDLNGNGPLGLKANTYRLLAEALHDEGVSTVRVDKRGMFSSAKAGDPNAVTIDKYAQDYRSWVETIRDKTSNRCVYMMGHSEGALMVNAASAKNENVCGVILVSGFGRSFGDVLRAQLTAEPAYSIVLDKALEIIEILERGERVDTSDMHIILRTLFGEHAQNHVISLMQTDPAALAREANKETLIIQGSTDLQVSMLDAEILTEASGGKLIIIDGMNHVLKDAPKNRLQNIATYGNSDLPLSEGVVVAINEFVEKEKSIP